MIKVTETIKKVLKQREAGILSGEEATYKLLVNLNRQVREELGAAALGSWTEYQMRQTQAALERRIADYETAAKGDLGARVREMFELGQESVYKPLNAGGIFTGFSIPSSLVRTLEQFAFVGVEGYTGAMWTRIRSELSLAALSAKTPQQVAQSIGKLLPEGPTVGAGGRTIFKDAAQRAEFITKTELGRVYSEAANRRRQEAAQYVPDLEKVWRHGHPAVPRLTHLAAHGVAVPENKPFPVQDKNGYQLMFPHDPNADFSEVAGCQCHAVTWAKRWGEQPKAA